MALITTSNCYVTLDSASDYFNTRYNSSSWFDLSVIDQERALITATAILDSYSYVGSAIDPDQPLAFPRSGSYFDTKTGNTIEFTSTVPARIEQATYETALHFATNASVLEESDTVTELKVSSISIKEVRSASKINDVVKSLIRPMLSNSSNTWWRAN